MSTTIDLFRNTRDGVAFAKGEAIFTAGKPGELMYVVLEGEVEIRQDGRVLAVAKAGEVLGEMALIDHGPRSASAIARTDCLLAPVSERRFLFMVQETPFFALKVMQVLVERLRLANATVHAGS